MSDILTQIYGSADFQSVVKQLCLEFVDIFCREVKREPARVVPLKVTLTGNDGVYRKTAARHVLSQLKDTIMLELDLIEPSKSPYYSHVHVVRKPTGKWWFLHRLSHNQRSVR
jgi:hypothetical protein